jgi:hypothetical protein
MTWSKIFDVSAALDNISFLRFPKFKQISDSKKYFAPFVIKSVHVCLRFLFEYAPSGCGPGGRREEREREGANDMNEKGMWDMGGEGGEGETQARKEETKEEQ